MNPPPPKPPPFSLLSLEDPLFLLNSLASLGAITSSCTHEINNPLGIILGYTQSLLASPKITLDSREDLLVIEEEALRCAQMVQNLMLFNKKKAEEPSFYSLNTLLHSVQTLVSYLLLKKQIQIHQELSSADYEIWGEERILQHLFLNLFLYLIQGLLPGSSLWIQGELKKPWISLNFKYQKESISTEFDPKYLEEEHLLASIQQGFFGLLMLRRLVEGSQGKCSFVKNSHFAFFQIRFPYKIRPPVESHYE
jgi:light-regulated signal transduction histidine kinase (bacteriophytochrome)